MSLLENFVNHLVTKKEPITIFLTNGVKLSGFVSWADKDCVTLSRDGITQLVMLQAVATIMPQNSFKVADIMR